MKIYIWEHVLSDYTDGLAVAYAPTLEEALDSFESHIAEQLGKPTKIIDCGRNFDTYSVYVFGGG